MRIIRKIFKRDLKRLSSNWVAIFVAVAVCLVPSIYAWFNIGANMDPYKYTSGIKIGFCSKDVGTTTDMTGAVNAGDLISEKLKENDDIGWVFVDEDEATSAVDSGELYAALIVPADFSENMISFLNGKVEQPTIKYYVNEKKNAVASRVTAIGASTIQTEIGNAFKKEAAKAVVDILKDYSGEIVKDVNSGEHQAQDKLDDAISKLNKIRSDSKALAKTNKRVLNTVNDIRTATNKVDSRVRKYQGYIPEVDAEYNKKYADVTLTIDNLEKCLNSNGTTIKELNNLLDVLKKQLISLQDNVNAVSRSNLYRTVAEMSGLDVGAIAEFYSNPVELKSESFYHVRNFGSGMAPFYTNLAIWVIGLVLIALVRLEVDEDPDDPQLAHIKPTQAYFGRWMLFVIMGMLQATVICIGDLLLPDIQCEHPVAFVCAGVIAAFVYINIIYALVVAFKHIGKALAVILVIIQIPGSAGSYPIELMEDFFQALNPFLPFQYGINAMREAIAGFYGHNYIKNLAILLAFVPVALFIGIVLRIACINVNKLFDNKLAETGILNCEDNSTFINTGKLDRAISILVREMNAETRVEERLNKFEKTYKGKQRCGIAAIIILPILLLILLLVTNSENKLVFLILWISVIILVAVYLLWTEYLHSKLSEEVELLKYGETAITSDGRKGAGDETHSE